MSKTAAAILLGAVLSLGLSGCTYTREPEDLRGLDVRMVLIHTSDVHSRLFPYQYAPNTPDRNLGLLALPGVCRDDGVCSTDFGRSCKSDDDCIDFPTANVGGIARMATLVKRERGLAPRSLHLDSGDMFEGAPVFNVFNGEAEMRAMGLLGVQGMALGNHEFDKGATLLGIELMNNGPTFPIMAANYEWANPDDPLQAKLRRFISSMSMYNVKGIKVGVIGLGNVSSLESAVEGDNSLGLRARDSKQAVSEVVRILRPQVDLLVLLSHAGPDEDQVVAAEVTEDTAAIEANDPNLMELGSVDGIDIVLGGHLHVVYDPPVDLAHYDDSGNFLGHTVIVNSGAFAKFVGSLDMVVRMGDPSASDPRLQKTFIKSYTYKVTPVTDRPWQDGDPKDPCDPLIRCNPPHPSNAPITCPWNGSDPQPPPRVVCIPEDADMARIMEPYKIQMNTMLNLKQVYAVIPCPAGGGTCPKVLRNDPGGGDSQAGNMVANAMRLRREAEADFGLTNSLGIRADFESGPLTLETLYNVFPFDNTITTQFLSGDEVLQMLDFVAQKSSDRGCRSQVQVAGIYFSMMCDARRPVPSSMPSKCAQRLAANTAAARASWVGPFAYDIAIGDKCRKVDGTLDLQRCKPLDCFASYKVAVNDYISVGGSGFVVLKRNTTRFNTGISLRDALADYIRKLGEDPANRCDGNDPKWSNIKGISSSGAYDYSNVTCLLPTTDAHDGRILPTVR